MDVRTAMRSMWDDTCTVYEYHPIRKPNGSTVHEEVPVFVDEPCRLSFSRLTEAKQTDTAAEIVQIVKLFLDENVGVKTGSKIVIKCRGREFVYGYSGESGVFDDHQEIVLIPWKGWAV